MKAIRVDLSEELTEIEIVPIADNHWSDPRSDHARIMEDIAYIRDNDNVFCVLNGDLMDCAIASSVGDTYGASISPMDELRICVEIFKPLADKGKILVVVPGNHEGRHYKTNGLDLTAIMCQQLGIADRYSPSTALLFLRFGRTTGHTHNRKMVYTLYVSHGSGGGKKEGGKIQRLVDLSTICDADVYICGHTHLPATLKDGFARPNMANSSITYCTRLYVNTSAKLDYGGYAETLGFKVPCKDTPIIHLCGTRKEMRATI
ncbi:MAG: metallophosphoesterase [Bacteroidaceae bacterium]|nr:metallophosphoesterase [Bacteroidaceae bacterium]